MKPNALRTIRPLADRVTRLERQLARTARDLNLAIAALERACDAQFGAAPVRADDVIPQLRAALLARAPRPFAWHPPAMDSDEVEQRAAAQRQGVV